MPLAVLGWGIALRVPPVQVGLVALAIASPVATLAVCTGMVVVSSRAARRSAPSSGVLREMAASLRAGLSIRGAVVAAGSGRVGERAVRLARMGAPLEDVAVAMQCVPAELVSLLGMAGRVGGSIAGALDVLAAEEERAAEDRRELHAAAAPMLLQAVIVGGLPVLAVLYRGLDGSLTRDLAGGGAGSVAVLTGVVLIVAGLSWLAVLGRRAIR